MKINFCIKKESRGHLRLTRGTHLVARRPAPGRATRSPGPPRSLQQVTSLPFSLSSSKNRVHPAQARVPGALAAIFDLLLQPSVSVEIRGKSSLVCGSSTPPNRFLISKYICEYFRVLGGCSYELACLLYIF